MDKVLDTNPMIPTCHPERTHAAHGLCRACYSRAWDAKHPGLRAARRRAQLAENKRLTGRSLTPAEAAKYRARYFRRTFGITVEEYDQLVMTQCGTCAVCGQAETQISRSGNLKRLTVDHDHDSGRVRGLLCNKCNRAIGLLQESVDLLDRALSYVRGV